MMDVEFNHFNIAAESLDSQNVTEEAVATEAVPSTINKECEHDKTDNITDEADEADVDKPEVSEVIASNYYADETPVPEADVDKPEVSEDTGNITDETADVNQLEAIGAIEADEADETPVPESDVNLAVGDTGTTQMDQQELGVHVEYNEHVSGLEAVTEDNSDEMTDEADVELIESIVADVGKKKAGRRNKKRRTKGPVAATKASVEVKDDSRGKIGMDKWNTSSTHGAKRSSRKITKKQDFPYEDFTPKRKPKKQEDTEIDRLVKVINETCSQLETIGKEVLVLITDIKGPRILGSKAGLEFANETKIVTSEFQHFCDEKRSQKNNVSVQGRKQSAKQTSANDKKSQHSQSRRTKGIKRESIEDMDKTYKMNKVIKVKLKRVDNIKCETNGEEAIPIDKVDGDYAHADTGGVAIGVMEEDSEQQHDFVEIKTEIESDVDGDDYDDYGDSDQDPDFVGYDDDTDNAYNSKGKRRRKSSGKVKKTTEQMYTAKQLMYQWVNMDYGVKECVSMSNNANNVDTVENDRDIYRCDKCMLYFLLPEHLETHQSRVLNCASRNLRLPFYIVDDDRFDSLELENFVDESGNRTTIVMKDLLNEHATAPYKCVICKKVLLNILRLKKHLLTHSKVNTFPCNICGMQLKSLKSVKEHIMNHFIKPLGCENCFMSFETQAGREKHNCLRSRNVETEGNDQQDFTCELCGHVAPNVTESILHQTHHTKSKVVKCSFCQAMVPTSKLRRHMTSVHEGFRPFTCEVCGKGFKLRHALRRHELIHNTEVCPCPDCGKEFGNKHYLASHMSKIHGKDKKFICQYCGAGYNKRTYFDNHVRIHTGEAPYQCTVQGCEKRFRSQSNLQQHLRNHNEVGNYVCDYCGNRYKHRGQMNRHRKQHFTDSWPCKYCPEKFGSCWKYKQHLVKSHPDMREDIERTTNIRLHDCHICGKLYSDTDDYKRHMNAHSGIKPFKCDYCDKAFSDKSNLKAHEHIHKGTPKYKCRICYKCFIHERNLGKHMKRSHTEIWEHEKKLKQQSNMSRLEKLGELHVGNKGDFQNFGATNYDAKDEHPTGIMIDSFEGSDYKFQILTTDETILM